MQSKTVIKWISFISGAVVFAFSIIVILLPDEQVIGSVGSTASAEQAVSGVGLPIRLKIPKSNVDAAVEYVGLTPDGLMDAPKGPADVAWFRLGQRPGEIGTAVIAGHSGWKDGIPAAFDYLSALRKGDRIYVEDDKGTTIVFIVREIRTYDPNADASSVFGSSDGGAHLNLITCAGVWDNVSRTSSERLVVFAEKE